MSSMLLPRMVLDGRRQQHRRLVVDSMFWWWCACSTCGKGGDDFLREKGGLRCGIRQAFVACYKSETSSELGGVRLFDGYEGRHS
jgi:hypothetical protein